jgi:hypothetical protein
MNDWRFIRYPDATWSWLNVERDHVSGSFHHFSSLAEAVRNAVDHGYKQDESPVMDVQHERRLKPRTGTHCGPS